MKQREIPT